MTTKKTFVEYRKYLKQHPELEQILKQLRIDEESYFKALNSMNPNRIVSKKNLSDKTY